MTRRFSTAAVAAGGLLLTGLIALTSATAREPWPGDPGDAESARPHPNCEGLSNEQELLACERRMRERMRNSSDDPEEQYGAEELGRRKSPAESPDPASRTMQSDNPPAQSPDRKRISQRDKEDRARNPSSDDRRPDDPRPDDRSRSSSSPQQRAPVQDSSPNSDSLGRGATRQPDYSDNSSPQTTTQTDTSPTSRDADAGSDTLDRDRNQDNSATDTDSPK